MALADINQYLHVIMDMPRGEDVRDGVCDAIRKLAAEAWLMPITPEEAGKVMTVSEEGRWTLQ